MFRPLGDSKSTPSEELSHFTNRVDETAAFERILKIPKGEPIPVLMFYGVGGAGKTWVLRRLLHQTRTQAEALPTVYLDLDPLVGGRSWANDPSSALAEIRRQLGDSIKCPRFDLAYSWLRRHEGRGDEPLLKGEGLLSYAWKAVVDSAATSAGVIPGGRSATKYLIGKATAPVKEWLSEKGVQDWLASKSGQEDFLTLKNQLPSDIYPQLCRKLLADLQEHLPNDRAVSARAVVFLDTVEAIREDRSSTESADDSQSWLRDLYHPDSGLFVVMGGRDRLPWDRSNNDFAKPEHLEQHIVGGLSESDALLFLSNCEITDPAVQKSILGASRHKDSSSQEMDGTSGYHSYSLGLCADTCYNLTMRGETVDPNSFNLSSSDTQAALAIRFLRSMGGDATYAEWLKRLSLTPSFNEAAARACFSDHESVEQDTAWNNMLTYSFISETQQQGWFRLHATMRSSLAGMLRSEDPVQWQNRHKWWFDYWSGESVTDIDSFSATAWYHAWKIAPDQAVEKWASLASDAHKNLQMEDHYTLIEWWDPCELNTSNANDNQNLVEGIALCFLGREIQQATVGDRTANLQRAIEFYKAALCVVTEKSKPHEWGITQHGLGLAFTAFPKGDRVANLQKAIDYYEAALRVRTERKFPSDWAETQNELANVYRVFPLGDKASNVRRAIECYKSAVRVYTRTDYPQEWAVVQHNLAIAYRELPGQDTASNLRSSISHSESALQVYTEEKYPREWAGTQNALANTYIKLPSGDKNTNLQRAIDHVEAALRVYTEDSFPQLWAMAQITMVNAYNSFSDGSKLSGLRKPIALCEAVLRVYTHDDFPQEWAATQVNLASAYYNMHEGEKDANLGQAIVCCEAALRVYTEDAAPHNWALVQLRLASVYRSFATGDRLKYSQQAIDYYKAAQRVYGEKNYPQEWIASQESIANIHFHMANYQQSISCYEAALRVCKEGVLPQYWAELKFMLGAAYDHLPNGDRGGNLLRAAECYEDALRAYRESNDQHKLANINFSLANAYSSLSDRGNEVDFRRTIECYKVALGVHTFESSQDIWAVIQYGLAEAHRKIQDSDKAGNLNLAVKYYEAYLKVHTVGLSSQRWARTQLRLADTYGEMNGVKKEANCKAVIKYLKAAQTVYTEEEFPLDWAAAQLRLADSYGRMAGMGKSKSMQRSIEHAEAALRVFNEVEYPKEYKNIVGHINELKKKYELSSW